MYTSEIPSIIYLKLAKLSDKPSALWDVDVLCSKLAFKNHSNEPFGIQGWNVSLRNCNKYNVYRNKKRQMITDSGNSKTNATYASIVSIYFHITHTQTMTASQRDWQQHNQRHIFHFEAALSRQNLEWLLVKKKKGLLDVSFSKLHVIIVWMCL